MMVVLAPVLNSNIKITEKLDYLEKQLKGSHFQQSKQPSLLQAIIEGFVDGILILTDQGELVHANDSTCRIFHQMSQGASKPNPLAEEIQRVYKSLVESHMLLPKQQIIIESEIEVNDLGAFRIRARWLELNESESCQANCLQHCPYLLVTIEDRHQSRQNAAVADAKKYGLTPREAEVWLLRRDNYSYKKIADKLYITLNTVKKHIKNIRAKQEALLEAEE